MVVRLRLDNGLVVESDEDRINSNIISQSLSELEFTREGEKLFRRPGDIHDGIIIQVRQLLEEFFEEVVLDGNEINQRLTQRTQDRQEIEELRNQAVVIKKLIERGEEAIPDVTVPRLRQDRALRWYQRLCVHHAMTIGNSANFSVPGSGKTWMAYSTFFKMKDEDDIVDRLLVIGPKIAYRSWQREYEFMTGVEPDICQIAGTPNVRQGIFATNQSEICFINYAMLDREIDNVIRMLQGDRFLVIADESHHFKNYRANVARAISAITPHCTRKMILTGTMMPYELEDVWTQFNFLLSQEGILPDVDRFRATYPNDSRTALTEVSELVNPFFFRITKPRLGLPPQTFNEPDVVEMGDTQRRIYNSVAGLAQELDAQYRDDLNALAEWRRRALVYLIEAATDPSLLPHINHYTGDTILDVREFRLDELLEGFESIQEENPPPKLARAIELARETLHNDGKVVIWCSFIRTIEKLSRLFRDQGIENRIVYGAIPADEDANPNDNRSIRIDEFLDDDNINVLIANPATLAESISLHEACHHAIYVDRTFNGGHYMQSLERIHRVGLEENAVTRYDIIQSADSIDQRIHNRLGRRQDNMNHFLESADLAVARYREENNEVDYTNPIGGDNELNDDWEATFGAP